MKKLLIIICVALLIGGGSFLIYRALPNSEEQGVAVLYVPPETQATDAGLYSYVNEQYGFSVSYPEELAVHNRAETGGAHTTTFESVDGGRGFQIYIRPYKEDQITQSAIQKDTRGTAKEEPVEVVIGNSIRALMFSSSHVVFGEMREVWFLHDGYLYEVTTYADLDAWLADVMKTWKFL